MSGMLDKLLRQKAYEKIKTAIETLRFEMGQSLSEQDLSSKLKIGRTPVREALQQLANEGLIVIMPRKGAYVSTVNLDDFQKVIESRIMLETYCVRNGVKLITAQTLGDLRSLVSSTEPLIAAGDIDALLKIDRQIHMGVVSVLANQYIEQIANQIYDRVARLWHLSFRNISQPELKSSLSSHYGIVDSLGHGDPEEAEKAVKHHIDQFVERVYNQLRV
jgi:GntR family transcriptional regulator, rspAB operon transcriptional repressor